MIPPHFSALLTFLPNARTTPVSSGFRPTIKFPFEKNAFTSIQNFPETELVFPGDVVNAEITLLNADGFISKIYKGLDFEFFEAEILIGHGVVISVFDNTSTADKYSNEQMND